MEGKGRERREREGEGVEEEGRKWGGGGRREGKGVEQYSIAALQ